MNSRMHLLCLAAAMFAAVLFAGENPGEGPWRALGGIQPRLAPDGSAIVFSYQGAIWRMPREGGVARRLTSGAGYDMEPAWSPDRKRIAYVDTARNQLRLIDAETGAALALPKQTGVRGKIYFHPDGRRLLGNFGQPLVLSWLDLETGESKPLLGPAKLSQWHALSPDGTQVAYVTTLDLDSEQMGNNGPQVDVWIVPETGGAPRKVVRFRSRIYDLCWGSSGHLFASSDLGGAHNDLWAIHTALPAGGHRLTNGQADEDSPSVSADGRWLLYTDNRANATAFVLRDLTNDAEQTLSVTALDFGVPAGNVRLRATDAAGATLAARVSLTQKDGKSFAPPGTLYRITNNIEHFYTDKEVEFSVPAGRYSLRAFRGLEFRPAEQDVEVAAGQTATAAIALQRWADPAAKGWWGGESHIHANYGFGFWYNTPETMRVMIEGEGLHAANLVVANSGSDGLFDREFFRGEPDPLSTPQHILYWNEEFRATLWGHMTLLNLKHLVEPLMTGFKDTTNPWDVPTNSDIADHVHLQGGHANYTHPATHVNNPFQNAYAAKALPIDVALGKIDSLDINWGWDATVGIWHRLLNCGFRLPAAAGTDCFVNRLRCRVPGGDRAYVKIDGPFSFDAWVKGLKAGRSFVTNGPLLDFTANGQGLGETITLAAPGDVALKASAHWQKALREVDIVFNGEVLLNDGTWKADKTAALLEKTVRFEKSGWLSLRAYGTDNTQAHSGAIYVSVAGKPVGYKKDAQYFIDWIEQVIAELNARNRVPSAELKTRVDAQIEAALKVYRKIAAEGTD